MGPEFLSAIQAYTALETPQNVLTWTFEDDVETPLTSGVSWDWSNLVVRRSEFKYPEDETDGDSILSEAYSTSPSTSKSDTSSLDALKTYYYSLFLQYMEHSASPIDLNIDVERLGVKYESICNADREQILTSSDGVTVATQATITSATAAFLTNDVQAGYLVEITDGGADDGWYRIVSVDSATQITLDSALTLGASNVDFEVYTDHDKFWIAGLDYSRKATFWRFDSKTEYVDYKCDVSGILDDNEFVTTLFLADSTYFYFLTNLRYIKASITDELESTDISVEWDLSGKLPGGYEVTGAFYDPSTFQASDSIYILDSTSLKIHIRAAADGAAVATIDLSGLDEVADGTLVGLAPSFSTSDILVGNRNYVYRFPYTESAPDALDIDYLTYARQLLTSDIDFYFEQLNTSNTYVAIVDWDIDKLQTYTLEQGRGYIWQQPFVSDDSTVALYHLDESSGNPADSSPNSYNGTNVGMTAGSTAHFSTGYEATAVTQYINILTIDGGWNGAEGSVSIWFAFDAAEDPSTGTHTLFDIRIDANNVVKVEYTSGSLVFTYIAGGTTKSVSTTAPTTPSDFHNYVITWSSSNDEMKAYVDGVQAGSTQSSLGTWAVSALTLATIGHATTAAVGIYDEMRVSDAARTIAAPVYLYTSANKMHAFSGRDYDATYEDGDPQGFHYRDEIFTPRFMGGDFIPRNDYNSERLHPPDKVIEDSEVVFRGPDPLPTLGHLGRLTRLVGLFIDRFADDRERFINIFDRPYMDVDDMPNFADMRGIKGLDTENWNVDMQRRYIEMMTLIMKRGGRPDSYTNLAYLLGFFIETYHLQARRRLDSVIYSAVEPAIQAIYLDQMGSLDTSHELYPLALLRFRFYRDGLKRTTGSTSIPANRLFTDAGASFRDTADIGDMIKINDPISSVDNDKYLIEEIHSDTVVKVDADWPTGSQTGLAYTLAREVPEPDPWIDYLIERFEYIAPDSMLVQHRDA